MKINQDQAFSIARSVLKIVGSALVAHGATKAAGIVNGEDVLGLTLTVVGLLMSQQTHSDPTPPPNEPKTI
jgi:hypothetical protein